MANTWQRTREFTASVHGTSPASTSHRPGLPRTPSESSILTQEELDKISACDLLNKEPAYNGFLYKRAKEKVTDRIAGSIQAFGNLKWQLRYVVLYQHRVVYYKNERSSCPQGSFSLRGYNRVLRSVEMESADQQWAFKLIGLRSDDRTWYFAAASEREMKLWMAHFKVAMEECLHGEAKDRSMKILKDLKAKSYADSKQSTIHELEETRQSVISTESSNSAFEPGVYEDIESEVYDDTEQEHFHESYRQDSPEGPPPRERPLPQPPDFGSSPKSSQWGSLQRPMLPTRSPMPRRVSVASTTSEDSDDYIKPNEPEEEPSIIRSGGPRIPNNGFNKKEEELSRSHLIRRGPEGDSFRTRNFEEKRHPPFNTESSSNIQSSSDSEEDRHDYEPPPEQDLKKKPMPPPANTKPKKKVPVPPPVQNKPMFPDKPDVSLNKPPVSPNKPSTMPRPMLPRDKPPISTTKPSIALRPLIGMAHTQVDKVPHITHGSTTNPSIALKPLIGMAPTPQGSSSATFTPGMALKPPRVTPFVNPPNLPEKINTSENQPTEDESKPPPTKPKPPPMPTKPRKQQSIEHHQDVEELLPHSAMINSCDKHYCEGLLQKYKQEGMYLLRMASDQQGKVLMVWYEQERKSKHYKVFGDNISNFGLDTTPRFTTMTDLIIYYRKNHLPHSMHTLTTPYRG